MPKDHAYCPYDVDDDYATYNLVWDSVGTRFGEMYFARSTQRTSDTALLLLHGVANDWSTWTPLLREARQRNCEPRDLIMVDLPGFGASQNKLGHLNIEEVGAELTALVRHLGYTRVRLVGHSMGGFLAMDMASRRQIEVVSLHLISGTYFSVIEIVQEPLSRLLSNPSLSIAYGTQELLSRLGGTGAMLARATQRVRVFPLFLYGFLAYPWRAPKSLHDSLVRNMRPQSFTQAAANGDNYDTYEQWAKINCPVRAVFGDRDKLVPKQDMAELRRLKPGAEARLLRRCGHFGHIERPAETYAFLFPGGLNA